MKKFIRNILFFFFAIAIVDVFFGLACQYMNDHSKGGGVKSRYYACKESNEDILIFGSSRAKHHYVPSVIEDSLKMTCYNTGEDGNGIIMCYGFLKMITQRYSPKCIIYDVSRFDIYEDDNIKYLDLMKPYYYEPGIDSIFWAVDSKTRLMMMSNLYRYNTTCLRVAGNFLTSSKNYNKGFSPKYGIMDYEPVENTRKQGVVDKLKIYYFDRFLQLAKEKKIEVICVGSPYYRIDPNDGFYRPIIELCENYGFAFWDYTDALSINNNKEFFNDRTHLNDEGARRYSGEVAKALRDRLFDIPID